MQSLALVEQRQKQKRRQVTPLLGALIEVFMSHTFLLILATIVTICGLIVVVWGANQVLRLVPFRARLLAGILLLIYGAIIIFRPPAWPVINIAVLIGAIGAVILIEGSLSSSGAIVTMLLVAATVDILSVSGGLTRAIIDGYQDGTSNLLLYLTLVVPINGRLIPIVGISDLFIGGATTVALIRLGLRPIAVIGAISIGLLGALVYGIWRGGVAALPFIAVSVLILVWRNSASSSQFVDDESTP